MIIHKYYMYIMFLFYTVYLTISTSLVTRYPGGLQPSTHWLHRPHGAAGQGGVRRGGKRCVASEKWRFSWETHGKPMGKPWENHGKMEVYPLYTKNYGNIWIDH